MNHDRNKLNWDDVTKKTTLDAKVYLISKGRNEAVASTHSDRDFKPKMLASGKENVFCTLIMLALLATVFSMAWYEIVMHPFLVV